MNKEKNNRKKTVGCLIGVIIYLIISVFYVYTYFAKMEYHETWDTVLVVFFIATIFLWLLAIFNLLIERTKYDVVAQSEKEKNDTAKIISEEYFNQVNGTVVNLMNIYNSMINDFKFLADSSKEQNTKKWLLKNGEKIIRAKEQIRLLFLMDIVKYYNIIKYEVDLYSKNGTGLFLVLISVSQKEKVTFEFFQKCFNDNSFQKSSENYLNIANELIENNRIGKHKFYISQLLETFDTDMLQTYETFLNNFASILTQTENISYQNNRIDKQKPNPLKEKYIPIIRYSVSNEEFNIMNEHVNRLADIYHKIKNNDVFYSNMNKSYPWKLKGSISYMSFAIHAKVGCMYEKKDKKDKKDRDVPIPEQIRFLFLDDIVKCYKKTDNSIDIDSKDCFAILLFWAKTENIETTYSNINNIVSINNPIYNSLKFQLKNIEPEEEKIYDTKFDDGFTLETEFFVSEVLKRFDTDLQMEYFNHVSDFALFLKDKNSTASNETVEWTNKLLKLNDKYNKLYRAEERVFYFECDPLLKDVIRYVTRNYSVFSPDAVGLARKFSVDMRRIEEIGKQLEIVGLVESSGIFGSREFRIKSTSALEAYLKTLKFIPTTTGTNERSYINDVPVKIETKKVQEKAGKIINPSLSNQPMGELNALIGLSPVKKEISTFVNFIKIQQERQSKGLKTSQPSYHCIFTGNPGTGKTTVARIVSEIYKDLGILKKGHLVETDRSGLVAEYVGQTAVKTNKIIDSALEGVLFIDEAYSLVGGSENDYGKEAIATLLKRMEDDRERLVVILAGYTDKMKEFINSNPGLQSRFNRYIDFPDYSAEELYQIFDLNLRTFDYTISNEASKILKEYFQKEVSGKDHNFGNARFVRNIFEKTLEHQANRLAKETNLTTGKLSEICETDIFI